MDDPPPFLPKHLRDKGFGDIVNAVQVDIEDVMPEFVGMAEEFVAPGNACIVDEDIYAAPFFEQGRAHGGDLLEMGDVASERKRLPTRRGDFVCNGLGVGESAGGEGDFRSGLGKGKGNGPANAFTAASDECAFVGERKILHIIP